jgi:hypothetical protein
VPLDFNPSGTIRQGGLKQVHVCLFDSRIEQTNTGILSMWLRQSATYLIYERCGTPLEAEINVAEGVQEPHTHLLSNKICTLLIPDTRHFKTLQNMSFFFAKHFSICRC